MLRSLNIPFLSLFSLFKTSYGNRQRNSSKHRLKFRLGMFHFSQVLFCIGCIAKGCFGTSPDSLLINHLLSNYHPDARPSSSVTKPVNLTFDIALKQMLDMDEKQQIMTTNVWIRHYWNDQYLRWDPAKWSNVSYLAVGPDKIWKPDITLYNNAERGFQGFDDFGKTRVNIYSTGDVVWLIPMILRSECKLSMTYFPFDVQYCPLKFGSWAYDGLALDVYNRNPTGDLSTFSKSGEFKIDGLEANRVSATYVCCPNPYVTITYTVRLHRRVKFYFYNLIIPGVLIAVLACFSFLLPPLSGERTGLIITTFLSLSVYVLMVSDSIPPSSESIPIIVRFYTVMISEIALALIVNSVVIPLANRKVPVPKLIKNLLLGKISKYVFCNKNTTKVNEMYFSAENDAFADNTFNEEDLMEGKMKEIGEIKDLMTKVLKTSNTVFQQKVLNYLKSIKNILKEDSCSKQIEDDWTEVVNILDRIFFVTFVAVVVISGVVLMLEAPEINF
ncbi:neuronal acetylcholine receptor subunit alpha-10-like [Hydractinia symbiolongicarpus]|uniref:neuronal acetylcholine receptor subunit alpha-10-like n=1 Tax=Hydractinia symbiolongicarpus TaxID=13093 RepID=UPI00254D9C85|nr:neuronal acetylcholine receptor subunit alpha-10-like [Hydractinia symbiolongicarpus]